jgi:hypothetical protein
VTAKATVNQNFVIGAVVGAATTFVLDSLSSCISNQTYHTSSLELSPRTALCLGGITKPPAAVLGRSSATKRVLSPVGPNLTLSHGVILNSRASARSHARLRSNYDWR